MGKKELLRSKIRIETWSDLRPKLRSNKLLILHFQADLVHVAMAVDQDNGEELLHYMNNGSLRRPTDAQVSKWDGIPDKEFQVIEVAKFTLFQELINKKKF